MKLSGHRGFTLIELMITIMIVGLLATVGTPMLTNSLERAKSSEARAALGSVDAPCACTTSSAVATGTPSSPAAGR